MIVERRRKLRNGKIGGMSTSTFSGTYSSRHWTPNTQKKKMANAYMPNPFGVFSFHTPSNWKDEFKDDSVTTDKLVVYIFAVLFGIASFAVSRYFFTG